MLVVPGRIKGPLRVAVLPFLCQAKGGDDFCKQGNERVNYFVDYFPEMILIPRAELARKLPDQYSAGFLKSAEFRLFRSHVEADAIITGSFVRNSWGAGQPVTNRLRFQVFSAHSGLVAARGEQVIPEMSAREKYNRHPRAQRDLLIARHSIYGAPARPLRSRMEHRVFACPSDNELSRVYVTGGSRGGSGTWRYGYALPKKIAALAPVAGAGVISGRVKCLGDTPLWASHGFNDDNLTYDHTLGNMETQMPGALFWGDVNLTASGLRTEEGWPRRRPPDARSHRHRPPSVHR